MAQALSVVLATQNVPNSKANRSQLSGVRIKDFPGEVAGQICASVTQSGNVKNTIAANQWSLGHFGARLATRGLLVQNPITPFIVSNPESIADKKKRKRSEANEQVVSQTFEIETHIGQGSGIQDEWRRLARQLGV